MKVLVSGSTGLVGAELCGFLTQAGHEVFRLVRRKPRHESEIQWDPKKNTIDRDALEGVDGKGFDAVINLAGEGVLGLWSKQKKQAIQESRVGGTGLLSAALASLKNKPKVLINASAIGYYGSRGDEVMTEMSLPASSAQLQKRKAPIFLLDPAWGSNFLSEVCRLWEEATHPAAEAGIRVVQLRTGVVLTPKGGALSKMLPAFKLGIAGPLGNGKQYMSWVTLDDMVGMINHVLVNDAIKGPVNAVAPNPVTNGEFTNALRQRAFMIPALGSVTNFLPAPAFIVRMGTGEMGSALLLSSTRVEPTRLEATGYQFLYPEIEGALKHVLN